MPRDTRSTDRCTRFESADLVHVCGCVHLSYALHLILALSPSTPSLREVLLSRNWRIEENREYRGLFRGDAFGRGVIRFICITTTVRAQSRSRAHGRSSNGHVQRTYSSNGACMHLIPVE